MRWRGIFVVAPLVLSACAFGSEEPLLAERDGVGLFADGQELTWNERPEGDSYRVRLTRDGAAYLLRRVDEPDDAPMRVVFVAVGETPEDDYVAQVQLGIEGAEGVAYAYAWRSGHGYRVFADPRAFEEGAPADASRYCHVVGQGECAFENRNELIGYYRAIIYPRFVAGHAAPASYLDLSTDFPDDGDGRPEQPTK